MWKNEKKLAKTSDFDDVHVLLLSPFKELLNISDRIAISGFEELYQHWSEDFAGYTVALAFQGAESRIWEDVYERLRRVAEERGTFPTCHHEHG